MKRFLLAVAVVVGGSALYGLTDASPVIICEPMPNTSNHDRTSALDLNVIPNNYIISLNEGEDIDPILSELQDYIGSQKQCSDTTLDNHITTSYKSENGGVATIAGVFDERVYSWIVKKIGGKGTVELDINLELDAVRNIDNSQWNLARINQKNKLFVDDKFTAKTHNWPFQLDDTKQGEGSRIYILDSGVLASHKEFQVEGKGTRVEDGRVFRHADGPATTDDVGHGTRVAGIAAGLTTGIAKLATIVPYKIVNKETGKASLSSTQKAISTAVDDFIKSKAKVGVINICVDFGNSKGAFKAIKNANKKMHVILSAGNNRIDRCDTWVPKGDWIGVGGTDIADKRSANSNYGRCVHVYAPGVDIYGPGSESDTKYKFSTGTSFSAPLVAGTVAVIELLKPEKMKKYILEIAAKDKITGFPKESENNHNLLLQLPVQD